MAGAFTIAEIAALTGFEERGIRNELEKAVIVTKPSSNDKRLPFAAIVYFALLVELRSYWRRSFDPPLRSELFRAIALALDETPQPEEIELHELLVVRIGPTVKRATTKAAGFRSWCDRLVQDDTIKGGEPVFPRSRLSVRHVGELLSREPEKARAELMEDYPFLSNEDLEFAPVFVQAYPRVGRPSAEAPAR